MEIKPPDSRPLQDAAQRARATADQQPVGAATPPGSSQATQTPATQAPDGFERSQGAPLFDGASASGVPGTPATDASLLQEASQRRFQESVRGAGTPGAASSGGAGAPAGTSPALQQAIGGAGVSGASADGVGLGGLGSAPTGVAYRDHSEPVPDSLCVFRQRGNAATGIDPHIASVLSQYDHNRRTTSDPDRCGATAAVVAAMNTSGPNGLLDTVSAARTRFQTTNRLDEPLRPGSSVTVGQELDRIEANIRGGDATVGDLGSLSDLLYRGHQAGALEPDHDGISQRSLGRMFRNSGMERPGFTAGGEPVFEQEPLPGMSEGPQRAPRQSWPCLLDTNGDGRGDHWVVFGREPRPPNGQGRLYVYDPMPTVKGQVHTHYEGSTAYDQYRQAASALRGREGLGWAP